MLSEIIMLIICFGNVVTVWKAVCIKKVGCWGWLLYDLGVGNGS